MCSFSAHTPLLALCRANGVNPWVLLLRRSLRHHFGMYVSPKFSSRSHRAQWLESAGAEIEHLSFQVHFRPIPNILHDG
jgi:hypothetical protein